MRCPICERGILKEGNKGNRRFPWIWKHSFQTIKETVFGVYLGEFPAEICNKCGESFTDEATTKSIEEEAKKKGIWGMGKKTKITKAGNSLAVRIPKEIAKFLNLKEGCEAYIHPDQNKIIIESGI